MKESVFQTIFKKYYWIFILLGAVIIYYIAYISGNAYPWEDALYIFYPKSNFFTTRMASGDFPFWLPGLRGGMPFYSDIQMGTFYPPNWLLIPFGAGEELPVAVYTSYLVLHVLMGGSFMYLFLRSYDLKKPAAITGAILFSFSGFMSMHIIHEAFFQVVVWLPLSMLILKKAVEKGKTIFYLLLPISVLMSFLPGSPQITLYTSYLLIAYWIFLFIKKNREENIKGGIWIKKSLLEILKIGGVFLGVLLLGAIQFLPSIQNWSASIRTEFSYEDVTLLSVSLKWVLHLFFPNFYGTFFPGGNDVSFWASEQYGAYWEFSSYAGTLGIIGFLAVLFNIKKLKSRPELFFFAGVTVLTFWFMMGNNGGLFRVLYHTLPGVSMFRTPTRMAAVLGFALAFLGGYLTHLATEKEEGEPIRKSLLYIGIGYLAFFLFFAVTGGSWGSALRSSATFKYALKQVFIGIVWLGLLIALFRFTASEKVKSIRPLLLGAIIIVAFLDMYTAYHKFHKGDGSPEDYYTDQYGLVDSFTQARTQYGPFRFAQLINGEIKESVLYPRNMTYFHTFFEVPEGYVLFKNKYQMLFKDDVTDTQTKLDLQNILYYVNLLPGIGLDGGGILINTNWIPRVSYYHDIRVYEDADGVINALNDGSLDYKNEMALLAEEWDSDTVTEEQEMGVVTVVYDDPEEYRISYSISTPGILFVSMFYYPGWVATDSDGRELDILRAYGMFTGIVIPETGSGEIDLRFRPMLFRTGALISLSILLLWAIGISFLLRIRKKKA